MKLNLSAEEEAGPEKTNRKFKNDWSKFGNSGYKLEDF